MADAIEKSLQAYVDLGEIAGAATAVWRRGQATIRCVGWRDMAAGLPVEADTIFRIASLSKPVTSVAALRLMDEGLFELDEPIAARWAPEFAQMRVLVSAEGPLDQTVAAEAPITFRDLLTHRSGLSYADFHRGPVRQAYDAALGPSIDTPVAPEAWIAGLAKLPLIDQPGAGFHYGHSTDLLGLLLGRMEGASLGEVLRAKVFAPLRMHDTGFVTPADKRARQSADYGFDAAGKLTRLAAPPGGAAMAERPQDLAYEGGGAGLRSTVQDYLRFGRLFVGGGEVDGVRILRRETLAQMMTNQLTPEQRARGEMLGMPAFTGQGFGLGVAVVMEPEKAAVTRCGGGKGSVGWPGAYGGWWQADPNDGSVLVFLAHNMMELEQLMSGIGLGVYGAITEFQKMAVSGPA